MHKTPQNSISLLESSRDSRDTADGVVLFKKTLLPQFSLMKSFPRILFSLATAAACALSANAQSVTTDPVGFINITANAGNGTTKNVSVMSFPLLESDNTLAGQVVGRITGITANTITNSNAGWTSGALSSPATPYLIQFTSGTAKGRIFVVSTKTPNSATSLTIDAEDASKVDLTSLGIATGDTGDTYAIYTCDTISTLFGTPSTTGVLGAANPNDADNLQLFVNGAWRRYYYSLSANSWRQIGAETDANNVFIRPDSGVIYSRLATSSLVLTLIGKVPVVERKTPIANSGVTFFSNSWPSDLTLGTSGINAIPGWNTGSSTTSDVVQMFVSGAWRKYYYDGNGWKTLGSELASNSVPIPAGTAVILSKKGSVTGYSTFLQAVPYSL